MSEITCSACKGKGGWPCNTQVSHYNASTHSTYYTPCPLCMGTGRRKCNKCNGTGKILESK